MARDGVSASLGVASANDTLRVGLSRFSGVFSTRGTGAVTPAAQPEDDQHHQDQHDDTGVTSGAAIIFPPFSSVTLRAPPSSVSVDDLRLAAALLNGFILHSSSQRAVPPATSARRGDASQEVEPFHIGLSNAASSYATSFRAAVSTAGGTGRGHRGPIALLAAQLGVSRSTAWRRLKAS